LRAWRSSVQTSAAKRARKEKRFRQNEHNGQNACIPFCSFCKFCLTDLPSFSFRQQQPGKWLSNGRDVPPRRPTKELKIGRFGEASLPFIGGTNARSSDLSLALRSL
jgi:hypothetical protein